MLSSLLVFDIETIPDVQICEPLTGVKTDNIQEQRDELEKYHLKVTEGRNPFLRQPFHKIVAISFLYASLSRDGRYESYSLNEVRSGGSSESTEADLVKGFINLISKNKPRLISFNGRAFDLPVIKYRAMLHGIQAEYFHRSGDKWSNYSQRYSLEWHCDLLEALSDYGVSARVKMNEVCATFKLPGKIGVDGSQVVSLYDDGRLNDIRNYCEIDVLNTYLIYLRFMLHQGYIEIDQYNYNIRELIQYLKQQNKNHFDAFYLEWASACKDDFFF